MTELLSSRRHRVRPPIMRSIPHISVTRGHTYAIMIFLAILRRPSPPQTPRETLATCREGKKTRGKVSHAPKKAGRIPRSLSLSSLSCGRVVCLSDISRRCRCVLRNIHEVYVGVSTPVCEVKPRACSLCLIIYMYTLEHCIHSQHTIHCTVLQ